MADGTIKILTDLSTDGLKSGLSKLGGLAKTGLAATTKAISGVSMALAGMAGYSLKVGSSFEAGMSEVSAISGAVGKDLEALTDKAKEMGAKTKFSASESAEALKYMAMAGWDTEKMLGGLPGVMNLAAASGENLGTVSDIVTDAMTAFGLSADKSAHFADVLAKASSASNTNVGLMGATFKYVAPIAGAMKYSIEDTAVAIGLMANAGIKGEQAGTALRSMLTRLAKPPKDAADALDALGISAVNADGSMRPLSDMMVELREKFSGLTDAEKTQYASSIAGTEAMSGFLAIISASDDDFKKLTQQINNADGAAESMADTMNDNLKGSVTIAKSALEALGITVYEKMETPLRSAVETGTGYINQLNDAFSHGLDTGVAAIGTILSDLALKAADSAPKMLDAGVQVILSFADGIEKNSGAIATSAVKIGEALIGALVQIVPRAGEIGLKIISQLAASILGYNIGSKVDTLRKTIESSFREIVASVKNGAKSITPLFKNLATLILNVANTALPVLTKGISFLADNCKIIIPLVGSVLAGIKTWKLFQTASSWISGVSQSVSTASAAVKIFTVANNAETIATTASTGALTLKQIAVGVLTGKIGLATAAQELWNLAMSANPIGVVLIALAALTAGIVLLVSSQEKAETAEDRLAQANDNLAESYGGVAQYITEFQDGVKNATSILDGLNSEIIISSDEQQALADKMSQVQAQIVDIAKAASDERRDLTSEEIDQLDDLFAKMEELSRQQLEIQKSFQDAAKVEAQALASNMSLSVKEYEKYAEKTIAAANEARDKTVQAAEKQRTNEIAIINRTYKDREVINGKTKQQAIDAAIDNCAIAVKAAEKERTETVTILSDGYAQRSDILQKYLNKHNEINTSIQFEEQLNNSTLEEIEKSHNKNLENLQNENYQTLDEYYGRKSDLEVAARSEQQRHIDQMAFLYDLLSQDMDKATQEQLGFLLGMVTDAGNSYDELEGSTKEMVGNFLHILSILPEEAKTKINETLEAMNLEVDANGDLVYKAGEKVGEKFIEGFDDEEYYRQKAKEATDAMSDETGSAELDSPSIKTPDSTGWVESAMSNAQSYLSRNPLFVNYKVNPLPSGVQGPIQPPTAKHAKGGYTQGIRKHAAGVFNKKTIIGNDMYGENGHEALLPLKASVYDEIGSGIVRQLQPYKLSGLMSQLRSVIRAETSQVAASVSAGSNYREAPRKPPAPLPVTGSQTNGPSTVEGHFYIDGREFAVATAPAISKEIAFLEGR